ncbi:MAG: hypothetical protein HQL51_05350 [Magnetococcales bacterium]|nr:hypothetical protein [Magnetococcales bacterium]
MALRDQIQEQIIGLPDEAASEVLDFIGYLRMKFDRQGRRETIAPSIMDNSPSKKWDVESFVARFAGAIPDFPEIEDEGPSQEREWLK